MEQVFKKEKNLMEKKVMESLNREKKHELDKQMTVQKIVEEEKNIMENRFKTDVDKMQTQNAKHLQ